MEKPRNAQMATNRMATWPRPSARAPFTAPMVAGGVGSRESWDKSAQIWSSRRTEATKLRPRGARCPKASSTCRTESCDIDRRGRRGRWAFPKTKARRLWRWRLRILAWTALNTS